MDRPRRKEKLVFSGFMKPEIEKMDNLLKELGEKSFDPDFCKKIAMRFSRSAGRAGKPVVKWNEVQSWFQNRLQERPPKVSSSKNDTKDSHPLPEARPLNDGHEPSQMPEGQEVPDVSDLEFEVKSSKDGAWYDADAFLGHRYNSSDEAEVLVRFVGFGAEEDEWVNVKTAVRRRSVPFENSECHGLKVGNLVLCFQEKRDQSVYFDAHILEIQRRMHDIRGCRCLFLIRYNHDNTEERVRLRRLCRILR